MDYADQYLQLKERIDNMDHGLLKVIEDKAGDKIGDDRVAEKTFENEAKLNALMNILTGVKDQQVEHGQALAEQDDRLQQLKTHGGSAEPEQFLESFKQQFSKKYLE